MADGGQPNLNLSPEEKRLFYQLFQAADKTSLGVVTGEVAVSFFEKTGLPAETLGLIWQIADTQNRGLLTPSGFGVVMRLIGHAQAGRAPTEELAMQPGPLPRFSGLMAEPPRRTPSTTASSPPPGPGPVRVPPLNPDDVSKFVALFEKSEVHNGVISGEIAKQIFERAKLPNEVLGRIWNLVDTKQRGALDSTEFVLAMHLLTAYKTGSMRVVPQILPPGLYDAAARRGGARTSTSSRASPDVPPVPAIPKEFTGPTPLRTQSPLNRPQVSSPLSAQSTGGDWLITPQEKTQFDAIFANVDKARVGYVTGDQAVEFFTKAQLPDETLAQIWDLADIDSDGQLSRDEFAVAMYLVRQQRNTREPLPQPLPPTLVPPTMRRRVVQPPPAAPATRPASEYLFGLDVFTTPPEAQLTGTTAPFQTPSSTASRTSPPTIFKPFVPSSSFGQSITPQATGMSQTLSPSKPPEDLLGDADPEESKKLTQDTADLANLSNQIGSLSKEMQNIQGKRGSAEQELAQNTQQKRDFEARLAQARAVYEQEVKDFKALEERLAISRTETKKLQQDLALIDGARQDLQNQLNQVSMALEADQRENASLKEKIREANTQVSQLRPQLEKIRSEARQQRGLVAINKKQLATVEGERDRLQDDVDIAAKEVEDLRRSLPETATVTGPPIASPTGSAMSQTTNPFFRRTTTNSSENPFPPEPAPREVQSDPHSLFDNVFGPSFSLPSASSAPPTSFRTESSVVGTTSLASPQLPTANAMKTADMTSASSPSGIFDDGFSLSEPPPPPQSRQFSSSVLPFLDGHQSVTSSTKPSPPASRLGVSEIPEVDVPVGPFLGNSTHDDIEVVNKTSLSGDEQQGSSMPKEVGQAESKPTSPSLGLGQSSMGTSDKAPGDFPTSTAGATSAESVPKDDVSFDELFGGPARQRSQSQKAMDFEEAFAAMKVNNGPDGADFPKTNGTNADAESSEFPPIRELGDDDDSTDSETPIGFDDDFSPVSPPRKQESASSNVANDPHSFAFPPPEAVGGSDPHLAGPETHISLAKDGKKPLESTLGFNGLAAAEPPQTAQGSATTVGYGANTTPQKPPADFEAAFAGLDLAPAKEIDDDDADDDDDFESQFNKDPSNFDMSFESPSVASKSSTIANAASTNSGSNTMSADFFSFGNNIQPAPPPSQSPLVQKPPYSNLSKPSKTNDWETFFSALDTSSLDKSNAGDSAGGNTAAAAPVPPQEPTKAERSSTSPEDSARQPGWALSADAGEDDLILKSLTGMGYRRDESLAALEKFDYNIDKAADFLASKS